MAAGDAVLIAPKAGWMNWLGHSQYSGDPYLDGQLDDFRIYAGALSATEVAALAA